MTLKLSTGVPGALAGREAQVAELARESLAAALQSGSMDARVALVGSLLVQAAGADPLALALAGALEQAATALIRGIVPA